MLYAYLVLLSGCGVQWVRPRSPEPKSSPSMAFFQEPVPSDVSPFGAHLMGMTSEKVEALLGAPAKVDGMLDQDKEAWYYDHPQKAKLYFRNGTVAWWSLTKMNRKVKVEKRAGKRDRRRGHGRSTRLNRR